MGSVSREVSWDGLASNRRKVMVGHSKANASVAVAPVALIAEQPQAQPKPAKAKPNGKGRKVPTRARTAKLCYPSRSRHQSSQPRWGNGALDLLIDPTQNPSCDDEL